jgi:hypothetical protein
MEGVANGHRGHFSCRGGIILKDVSSHLNLDWQVLAQELFDK